MRTGVVVLLGYIRFARERSVSLLGVFLKLSHANSTSVRSRKFFFSIPFAFCTAPSARPFDCACLELEVTS